MMSLRVSSLLASDKTRFLMVGGWNTLVGYLVFVLLHLTVESSWGVAGTLVASYCIALPHSFITQRVAVFRSNRPWMPEFIRFLISNSSIFIANMILLPLAVALSGANSALLQAIFLFLSAMLSYMAHKHYTFSS
ncbi:MAG: hypothetical protein DI635_10910 [Pseudoxanthomonas suwonensis]|nr:MAG: hypothetical protein DI635_10910 [Pseudoxanthomonas suwonensis]